ncbi:MAG: NFACT RNA binding domain-containing protein [Negativicutes bacterium]|jgi:predicted ribosome quality control (RQC) complex YloA/Tae2 family protein
MNLEGIAITRLCRELNGSLIGGRIERIFQPDKHTFIFHIRGFGENLKLVISLHPEKPSVFLAKDVPENPDAPPTLCMLLRKHLEDGKIASIEQISFDRIIKINIDVRGEKNRIDTKQLYLELMGKNSNLIFCHNGIIIDSLKRIGINNNRFRQILPALTYELPPPQTKLDLRDLVANQNWILPEVPLIKALMQTIGGIGPQTAKHICDRAGLPAAIDTDQLEQSDITELFNALVSINDAINNSTELCSVVTDNNQLLEIAPYKLEAAGGELLEFAELQEAVLFAYNLNKRTSFNEKDKLTTFVNAEINRASHKLQLLESDLRKSENAECYKIYGDVLLSYGFMVEGRPSTVKLPDIYNDNAYLEIPLDVKCDAAGNAKQYYAKYNKLQRAESHIKTQIAETIDLLNYLETIGSSVKIVETRADVEQIEVELREAGIMPPLKLSSKSKLKRSESAPLQFKSPGGLIVLVGKNNKQNDIVTFKLAAQHDLWFHTKDIPGSHIILKCGNTIPEAIDIAYAARLAAHYSKARESTKVPVDYTERRHVKKPAGAKPGFVIFFEQKTIMAAPLAPGK